MVVLVCDDDAGWCRALGRVLGSSNTTIMAHDIESALLMAEKYQPNVLVLDSLLPDGIGWQAIPRFRSVAPRTAIVVMTAFARVADGLRVIGDEFQAYAYLDKGEGVEEIRRTVRDAFMASMIGAIRERYAPAPPRPLGAGERLRRHRA